MNEVSRFNSIGYALIFLFYCMSNTARLRRAARPDALQSSYALNAWEAPVPKFHAEAGALRDRLSQFIEGLLALHPCLKTLPAGDEAWRVYGREAD